MNPSINRGIGALSFVLIAAAGGPGPARAETVALDPVGDNTLFEDVEGDVSSGSGPLIFVGKNNQGNTRRGVLAFDVASVVPPGATIDAVELQLTVASAGSPTPRAVTVHRVSAAWGEGASVSGGGSGAPAAAGDATWLHRFYPDSAWSAPGGDFDAASSASTMVAGEGEYTWTAAALTADVQFWLDNPAADFGWLLRGDEAANQTARSFTSREGSVDDRPRLVIEFTPDDVATEPATWGTIKAGAASRD